jgi:hypothetical protein
MHLKSRIPLVLGAAAAITTVTAATALGGNVQRIDSSVTLATGNPFHGRVVSEKHACSVHRRVKVFNKRPGPDGFFGKTRTNRRGAWSIPATPNGNFYAKMKRREEGTAGTTFVCTGDRSKVRHFGA